MPPPFWPQIILEGAFVTTSPVQPGGTFLLSDATYGLLGTNTLGGANAYSDLSPWVRSGQVSRPTSRQQGPVYTYPPSTMSVVLNNKDGRFDPSNLGGPYVSAGATSLTAMVPVRIRAVWGGIAYPLFDGFADSWADDGVNYGGNYAETSLSATDAQKVLQGMHLTTLGSPVGSGELTGARIDRILTAAGWYTGSGRRTLAAGDSALQATSFGDTPWNLMQLAADSELGDLGMDRNGAVVFRNRHALLTATRSTTPQAVFGDELYGTYDALVLAAAPLAWWQLDDAAGSATAADASGNSHPGTATRVQFGQLTQAVAGNFTVLFPAGVNAGILTAYNPGPLGQLTAEAWINAQGLAQSGNPRIITSGHTDADSRGFQLMILPGSGQVQFWVGNGSATGNVTAAGLTQAGWIYLAATWDGTTMSLYVNGVLAAGGAAGFTGNVSSGSASGISLGYAASYNGDYFTGLLSEAAVYGTALSPAQVAGRYGTTTSLTENAYKSVTRARDDTTIANDVQATRAGGSPQEAFNQASINRYLFARTYQRQDLILTSDPETLNWAQWVSYIGAGDEDRVDQIVLNPLRDPAHLWPLALGLQRGDRITVLRRPPGVAGLVAKDCFIRGVSHSFDAAADTWTTTFTLQDASRYGSFWTLDAPVAGKLDTNALAYLAESNQLSLNVRASPSPVSSLPCCRADCAAFNAVGLPRVFACFPVAAVQRVQVTLRAGCLAHVPHGQRSPDVLAVGPDLAVPGIAAPAVIAEHMVKRHAGWNSFAQSGEQEPVHVPHPVLKPDFRSAITCMTQSPAPARISHISVGEHVIKGSCVPADTLTHVTPLRSVWPCPRPVPAGAGVFPAQILPVDGG